MADIEDCTRTDRRAIAADVKRERDRLRYHAQKASDPTLLERRRKARAASREGKERPKRTEAQRLRERECERRRYAATKADPEFVRARREIRRTRHSANPEKRRAQDAVYLETRRHDEAFRVAKNASSKRYAAKNRELLRLKAQAAPRPHMAPEQIAERRAKDKAWYQERRTDEAFVAACCVKAKAWRLENPGRKLAADKRRLGTVPAARALESLRVRMRRAVKAAGARKARTSSVLIGCSLEHLRDHLEQRFRDGMSWDNYGRVWHVDHIRPCCTFDMSDVAQQRECFRWTNLQPLLVQENLRKSRNKHWSGTNDHER